MTELSEISRFIIDILGMGGLVTSVVLIIDKIRYRKQEKKVKESEAISATEEAEQKKIENDKAAIDLAERYKQKVVELEEERNKFWTLQRNDMIEIKQDIKETKQDTKDTMNKVSDLEEKYGMMERYLNGEYQNYLKSMRRKRPMPRKKTENINIENE